MDETLTNNDLYGQFGENGNTATMATPVDPYADPPYPPKENGKTNLDADRDQKMTSPDASKAANRDRDRRSRSRSLSRRRSPRRSSPPRRPAHAPAVCTSHSLIVCHTTDMKFDAKAPMPTKVLGVFGLSIRTQERDLEDEFGRHGAVESCCIVYDQRVGIIILKVST